MNDLADALQSDRATATGTARRWLAFASARRFDPLAGRLAPWFFAAALLLLAAGLYVGFRVAPTDAQQGEVYRIIFIHVPAAWMSMFIYLVMAGYSALALVFHTRLSSMMASALAPTGALFTVIALASGALWGQPTWGTWWVWDARLTSELILLFLYLGYMALEAAIDEPRLAERLRARLGEDVGLRVVELGAVVGAHVGPGTLAVAVVPRIAPASAR